MSKFKQINVRVKEYVAVKSFLKKVGPVMYPCY